MAAEKKVRIRLDLRYLGTGFHGWASQPGLRTVQGEVEKALFTLLRVEVALTVAGRTDAGVHAAAQVANFDVEPERVERLSREGSFEAGLESLHGRLNGLLARGSQGAGADVVVTGVQVVSEDFDARFSALARHYSYRISDEVATNDPLTAAAVWWVPARLDVEQMERAGASLIGEHDFLSFCKPREGATTIRTLTRLEVQRTPHGVEVRLSADAFCHSMVRSIVGALVEVGRGRRSAQWLEELVRNPGRENAAPIAPAHGLTMMGVDYPSEGEWRAQQGVTRRVRSLVDSREDTPCDCE
ncbi:MAG: tRNA pseudouridine(38-40) synthase TruA [Actinomycetaceae bacterium]|nr:tRNA pseudouridine(38-40) synthase TruA [Actinomycetaceae bacterium]